MHNPVSIIKDIYNLNSTIIAQLAEVGFSYVKLPDQSQIQYIEQLHSVGLNFFRKDDCFKKKYLLNEKIEGYADRELSKNPQSLKQFLFRPENPVDPFIEHGDLINKVTQIFQFEIALTLLEKIFHHFGLMECFENACGKLFSTFAFLYYPEKPRAAGIKSLGEHKDFEMISVLWITKPGLQVYYNNNWFSVDPLPGHVVVNLSNTLEIMLGKKCKSALHRVQSFNTERLSFGIFIGPNIEGPLIDYTNGQVIFSKYSDYLRMQFNQYYNEV